MTWVIAHPSTADERSGQPLAQPAFHVAMARSRAGRRLSGVLLGEHLARRRGPGGQTVAQVWAETGAQVAVIADVDPRNQASTRRLMVDGAASVLAWGGRVRSLGATMACWHTILDSPETLVPARADVVASLAGSGLDPMLRVSVPDAAIDSPQGLERLGGLLAGLCSRGYDLATLTLVVPMPVAHHVGQGLGTRLVEALVGTVPEAVRGVVVVSSRHHLHLAQSDAGDLAQALSRRTTPWPVVHSAGDLALRAAAAWWSVPDLAGGAARRFDRILELLAQSSGPVFTGRPPDDPPKIPAPSPVTGPVPGTVTKPPAPRRTRVFDTSLFRARSLYR